MKFLNKRTGGIIEVPCRLEGPDWEEITEAKKAEPKAEPKAEKAPAKAAPKKRTTARKG
jgi:hypothetical protein